VASWSASVAERVYQCPASAVLPQAPSEVGEAAERGTAIHSYMEALAVGVDRAQALERVPAQWRSTCEPLPSPPAGARPEVSYAIHCETGLARELGERIGRAYELRPGEVAGTADVVKPSAGHVLVQDYKTGRSEMPPAVVNRQLAFLAYAAATSYGASYATVQLVHIDESGGVRIDSADMDALDLVSAQVMVREIGRAVERARAVVDAGRTPDVRTGSHCRYCPARLSCPARVSLIRAVTSEDIQARFGELLTGGQEEQALSLCEAAEQVVADLRAQLVLRATTDPIRLSDGRVYGPLETERESVKGEVAWSVLRDLHGEDVARAGVEVSASKSSIERALKRIAKRGELAGLKRGVLAAVEAAGGIEVRRSTAVRAHHPKEQPNGIP
jgi:hypothetical protein